MLLARSVGRLAHHPKVGLAVVGSVAVAVIDIFAVTFTDPTSRDHFGPGGIPFGSTLDLLGLPLEVPVLFLVVACCRHGYFMDLEPLHFHFLRLRLLGLLGSLFQSPLILADRAQ